MTVLAAVSLRLILGVYRLLPPWQNSWCPLQPHCPAPSPARTQVGRHPAPLCVDPSPRQLATEVGTAQHRLDLNAGLLQHPGIAAAPHGFTTVLPASPRPHPKSSPVRYPGARVPLPEAKLGWDGSGRDTGSPQQGLPQALRGSTAVSGGGTEAAAPLQVDDPWNSINPTQHPPQSASLKWQVPALPTFTHFGVLNFF